MAEQRIRGITSLKVGDILTDGSMATTLTAFGVTYEGTAILEQAESTTTDFFSEENDDPEETVQIKGKTTLKWATIDFTGSTLESELGGTVVGTKWEAPSATETIEKSIEIVTRTGVHIDIPRAKIDARIVANLSKSALGQIEITATVLTPTKSGLAALFVHKPA